MTPPTTQRAPSEPLSAFAMVTTLARLASYCVGTLHMTDAETVEAELQRHLDSHAQRAPAELVSVIARYATGQLPAAE